MQFCGDPSLKSYDEKRLRGSRGLGDALSLAVVVGNPRAESRTLQVAVKLADAVARIVGAPRGRIVDLATVASKLFEWPNQEMAALNDEIARSRFVIFASPTYKATYTGLLKAFLDRYPNNGLASVIAIPVMTGASYHHAMAPDATLRPLLVELGASTPTSSLYLAMTNFSEIDGLVDAWATRNKWILDTMVERGPRLDDDGDGAGRQ